MEQSFHTKLILQPFHFFLTLTPFSHCYPNSIFLCFLFAIHIQHFLLTQFIQPSPVYLNFLLYLVNSSIFFSIHNNFSCFINIYNIKHILNKCLNYNPIYEFATINIFENIKTITLLFIQSIVFKFSTK